MLVLVIVLLCYNPFLIFNIFLAANFNSSNVVFLEIGLTIVLLNSSLNPFVYWRKRDHRAQGEQLLMWFCCQTQLQKVLCQTIIQLNSKLK